MRSYKDVFRECLPCIAYFFLFSCILSIFVVSMSYFLFEIGIRGAAGIIATAFGVPFFLMYHFLSMDRL